jgi:transposase-like protein
MEGESPMKITIDCSPESTYGQALALLQQRPRLSIKMIARTLGVTYERVRQVSHGSGDFKQRARENVVQRQLEKLNKDKTICNSAMRQFSRSLAPEDMEALVTSLNLNSL